MSVLGRAYTPRLLDSLVTQALEASGGVLIEGPRACGKTMTAMNAAASFAMLDDPGTQELAAIAPGAVLDGTSPRLLDEWQLAPQLWNLVRRRIDAGAGAGLFLLTGSAVPADDVTRHTGAGRILRVRQRTLTWTEKRGSTGVGVSISGLFDGLTPETDMSSMSYADVLTELVRPGFPALVERAPGQAARSLRAYIDEISRADVPRLVDMRHDPTVIVQLIAALARSVASDVAFTTLADDVRQVAPVIDVQTVASYVSVLERLFVVERQKPWTPALRSRARLRSAAKIHLADPALAAAALGVDARGLTTEPSTAGLLFESAVIHDLAVFADLLEAEVRYYRDSNGHEIDVVITLPDRRWGAVEVKLGGGQIAEGAKSLNRAVAQIDTAVVGEPVFRAVITGTGPTAVLSDGTVTCPLAALRP